MTVLKKILNSSTNVFELEEISLNRSKTIFDFLVFLFLFSHQSGNFIVKPCICMLFKTTSYFTYLQFVE
jgi:hypothetical protein